mgnify:CR=1 FL=1
MDKMILSGNEALARGAWEAGATVGTGYPGTPSTEILENFTTYPDVYSEWSVNEKVALEVGIGASLSGARTIVTMKHVGINVAADPLFTASYIGVRGGLVLICADDPGMHSSQNEQDSRNYAFAAKIPMLEPSDSEEARAFIHRAFQLSEKYDTPVIVRSTTRISHAKGIIFPQQRRDEKIGPEKGFSRDIKKYVMIPAYARKRHEVVETRMQKLKEDIESTDLNIVEQGDKKIGFITSGVAYTYVKELFPEASILKLGLVYPLPEKTIRDFCSGVDKVAVVEELDPFFELRIRAMGIEIHGKDLFPLTGEFNTNIVKTGMEKIGYESSKSIEAPLTSSVALPPRPPSLCPGCPHRTVYKVLREKDVVITGDIGCYTLGALPPYESMDTVVDMGASVTVSQGIEIVEGTESKKPAVSIVGDSTFAHSGLTGLLNAAYNQRKGLIIVLDNGTTAMTGMQPNPFSGERIDGNETFVLDYEKLAAAMGIGAANFRMVDAYKADQIETAIEDLIEKKELSLLVVKGLCIILKKRRARNK